MMYSSKMLMAGQRDPARKPSIRFAIVGNKRTGSSHLCSMLDSHPDVACWDDEIFESGNEFDLSGFDHPVDFLNNRVFRVPVKVVGFRLMWEALDRRPDTWSILDELDIWLIHTVRENRLDSFISFKLALINNSFTSAYGDWQQQSFVADYHEALEWFNSTQDRDEDIREQAARHSRPRLELEYGQICASPETALDFLNLRRTPLTSLYKKQRTGPQSASIENYEQLRSRFTGTPWAEYFTERPSS